MSFDPAHEPPRSRHWRHEEYWFQVPLVRLRALDDMARRQELDRFLVSPRASAIPRARVVRDTPSIDFPIFRRN